MRSWWEALTATYDRMAFELRSLGILTWARWEAEAEARESVGMARAQ